MNLRTYQMKSKHIKKYGFGKWVVWTNGYDTQKGIIWHKKKNIRQKNITSKDNQREQSIDLILIMSGWKEISWHVNHISIRNYIKLNLGVIQHRTIKKLEYQLVMQKWQKNYSSTQKHHWYNTTKSHQLVVVWVV